MTSQRKSAESREKDLRLAILRIERGRALSKATKLSIAAVAREVGVTPALIHNHYPLIAEEIRTKLDATRLQVLGSKQTELKEERKKNKDLRDEIVEMKGRIAKLASINEMLLLENRISSAKDGDSKVSQLPKSQPYQRQQD